MPHTDNRTIPYDLDAERDLLGSMMLSPSAIAAAHATQVVPTDFYKPEHGIIYRAIIDAAQSAAHPDADLVAAQLNGELDRIGGRRALLELQASTPASANAPAYARIVRDHSRRRGLIAISTELADLARNGQDTSEIVARITVASAPTDERQRSISGGAFTHDIPDAIPAIWGTDDRVLWAEGESLMLVGPSGVGKTTVAVQLLAGTLGLQSELLDLPITPKNRVLYLACDRPSQIQREFRRLGALRNASRAYLDERLAVWKGPPPRPFNQHPETLVAMAKDHGADCVFIDSIKDIATGFTKDEDGAAINSAIQTCLADGIEVVALHHQRKATDATSKPKKLDDVYGSAFIPAGAGSVVILWGSAGDPLVELTHLKQPAAEIGPLTVDHDHNFGISTVSRGAVDPLRVLRQARQGMTANDLAVLNTGQDKPNDVARRKAKRTLDGLVMRGLAHKEDGHVGGVPGRNGATPDRYYATVKEELPGLSAVADDEEPF